MKTFNYFQPTEIRFGSGRLSEVGQAVARWGKRCLLVTVPEFPPFAPLYARVKELLWDAGLKVAHFDGVVPNPTTEVITAGARLAKEHGVDVVLGMGGGSSMDSAKAIAVEATHPGTAWDYLFFRDKQPSEKTLPVVTATTTSGTGSQVTQVAVVTNTKEKNKSALYNSILYPKISIVDPELVRTAPPDVTASTGFDVFAHAFESYINPGGSAYTDLMALEAIGLVVDHLPKAVRNGTDLVARTHMAWADTLAGLCIANAGVTLPHGIGMAMSGLYPQVAHGRALAAVYPAMMRYTWQAAEPKFAAVARLLDPFLQPLSDGEAAHRSGEAVDRFLKSINLWTRLEDLDIPEDEVRRLAEASLVLPDYKNHPRVASMDEVIDLLKKSYRDEPENS
ncbi:MAG: iron-containing alcohol dehydrogenase [Candidatus Aminicenantes bacterium]|nr:iron-containing alcohol dehydrogenase [Candidatus Aminicenantes bacterium]